MIRPWTLFRLGKCGESSRRVVEELMELRWSQELMWAGASKMPSWSRWPFMGGWRWILIAI